MACLSNTAEQRVTAVQHAFMIMKSWQAFDVICLGKQAPAADAGCLDTLPVWLYDAFQATPYPGRCVMAHLLREGVLWATGRQAGPPRRRYLHAHRGREGASSLYFLREGSKGQKGKSGGRACKGQGTM